MIYWYVYVIVLNRLRFGLELRLSNRSILPSNLPSSSCLNWILPLRLSVSSRDHRTHAQP